MRIDRPPVTRSGAQRAARQELSKAIYHRNNKPLVERALDWVGRQLDRLLHHASVGAPSGNLGALAIVVVIVVIVIVVVWRVGIPRRAAASGSVLADGAAVTAADHRLRSTQAADSEDWNTAVIERMRAIARQLEESGILDPRAGRTASELAAMTATLLPDVATGIQSSARAFNDVAYGGKPADQQTLAGLVSVDEAVRATSSRRVMAQ